MMQNYLELDTEVLRADAYSRYSPNPEINVDAVQTFWDAMNEIKYIDSDLDIMDYVDETYYNTAMEQMLEENPDNTFYQELAKGGYGSNAE
jgi:tRNA A37 threonylcarbamoyladenosine dehydratase